MLQFSEYLVENRLPAIMARFEPQYRKVHDKCNIELEELLSTDSEWNALWNSTIVPEITRIDPTPNKIYTQWLFQAMLNIILSYPKASHGWFYFYRHVDEDGDSIRNDLLTFDRVKARMPANLRDINKFKTHIELRQAIAPYENTLSKTQEDAGDVKKLYDSKQIVLLYRGPEGKIEVPRTKEAAIYLGRGTKWCTAATTGSNYFESYDKRGKLFVITTHSGTKYQAHIETDSIMDAQDISVSLQVQSDVLAWALTRIVNSDPNYPKTVMKNMVNKGVNINFIAGLNDSHFESLWRDNPSVLMHKPHLFIKHIKEIEDTVKPQNMRLVFKISTDKQSRVPPGVWSDGIAPFRKHFPGGWAEISVSEEKSTTTKHIVLMSAYMKTMASHPNAQTPAYKKLVSETSKGFNNTILSKIDKQLSTFITFDYDVKWIVENYKFKPLMDKRIKAYTGNMYHHINNTLLSGPRTKEEVDLGKALMKIVMEHMLIV